MVLATRWPVLTVSALPDSISGRKVAVAGRTDLSGTDFVSRRPGSSPAVCISWDGSIAFSSEVDTGSLEENASKQKLEPGSDSIRTGNALALCREGLTEPICQRPGKPLLASVSHPRHISVGPHQHGCWRCDQP